MFPHTDSAKNAIDIFPLTDNSNDIHSVLSSQPEKTIKIQSFKTIGSSIIN